MRKYIVVERPFVLSAGILELTKEQYQTRKYCLKPARKKGQYEVTGPVCFKVGEEIGYDGKVPKIVQTNLVTLEEYAKGADAGELEVDLEKTVEALKAKLEAKDKELAAVDKELVEIKTKLEKMAKINQELLKKNEKPGTSNE
jgi:hypothetical protein